MSAARTVLTVAAALVVVPLAMRARESGAVRSLPASRLLAQQNDPRADPALVRAFVQGMQGSNAIQCEAVLQSFNSWSSNRAPDRDSVAWKTTMVVHQTIGPESVNDLTSAMKSTDECTSRIGARMLGRSELPAARTELIAALRADNASLRRLGAIGLGFSGDTTLTVPLVRALSDRDASVRAAAAWALGAVH